MSYSRNKQLLSDILAEESDGDFREALLDHTLRTVRRIRRFRKGRQISYALLMVAGLGVIGFHFLVSKPPFSKQLELPYLLVTTQPFPAGAVLSTTQENSIAIISSSPAVELVQTTESSRVLHQVGDDELLALLPSPALLVRRGPHFAEVVFANPDAQRALAPN